MRKIMMRALRVKAIKCNNEKNYNKLHIKTLHALKGKVNFIHYN